MMGLAFLARLDTLLLAAILGMFLMQQERRMGWNRESARRLLAYAMPVVLPVLLYAGINQSLFGCPVPISSVVKQRWSAALMAGDPLYRAHGWLAVNGIHLLWPLHDTRNHLAVAAGVFLSPLLLWYATVGKPRSGDCSRALRGLWPFAIYSIAQFALMVLLYYGDLSEKPWYYVIQPWLTALLAGALFQLLESAATRRQAYPGFTAFASVTLIMVWCAIPLKTLFDLRQWTARTRAGDDHPEMIEAANWVRANVPRDAVVGTWNAGTIGFLSGRRVVNLDGLVNSWDYAQAERHDLCGYFRKTHITYLVDAFENGKPLTRAEGFTDYSACSERWVRIWSSGQVGAFWHMEAYRLIGAER